MSVKSPRLFILDVGHGNSAVLSDTKGNIIIDAGPGNSLYLFLKKEKIEKIAAVLISHADKDHIGGLIGIIASGEFTIGKVRMNSDSLQGSKIWDDLLYTLKCADQAGNLDFNVSLSPKDTGSFDQGEVHVEILAPNLYIAGKAPGSKDQENRSLTSNSVSAVILLSKNEKPFALLPGDIDNTGLLNLLEDNKDPSAPILVFPHHGGKAGKDDMYITFTKMLFEAVKPEVVIFSNGRGLHATPRKEIIQTIREISPETRIACTELSENCAAELLIKEFPHLTEEFAQGKEKGKCCAGTIVIEITEDDIIIEPKEKNHRAFIEKAAPRSLCMS